MSLAEQYVARIVADKPPAILTVDIERLPGRASVDFWGLGDYKHRRIHADCVTEWPRTICFAWRWYGRKRIEFAAEWQDSHEAMLRKAWELFDRADIIVGHNVDRFDSKNLIAEWMTLGLTPPSPWKVVDTLKVARSRASFESNTLDALLKRLGVDGKTDKYSVEVARAACAGDRLAQRRIKLYNQGDIEASEALYDAVRPWIPNHPHIGLYTGDEECCGHCGGDLEPSGWHTTAVTAYAQYRCSNCGAWYRRTHIKARTNTRVAR
jgi:hypothetical protein